jgi:hypothetical protein
MLIPRFSLRWLLGVTTLCALGSLVLASAVKGEVWALGVAAAMGGLVLLAALHIATFLAAWLLSLFERATFGREGSAGGSPFAEPGTADSPFGAAVPAPLSESPPPMMG